MELNRLQLNPENQNLCFSICPRKVIGLNIDLNWKAHLSAVSTIVSRVIGLLHKIKYVFPSYILRMIYNSHSSSF